MQRIMVIGNCGAGKTTFSKRLAQQLQLPVIHMDQHFWGPNWSPMPKRQWHKVVRRLAGQNQWIMDGNYRSSFALRVPRADTIIFLDPPRWLAVWRVAKRVCQARGRLRPHAGGDNQEKLDFTFLKWVATFPRQQIFDELSQLKADQQIHVLKAALRSRSI